LSVSPVSGTAGKEPNEVVVRVDVAGLVPGEYACELTVTAPSAPSPECKVPVNLCFGCPSGPDRAEWANLGKPQSWLNPRQCHGDANGQKDKVGKCMYWVGWGDINVLLAGFARAYRNPQEDPWIAADFDHTPDKVGKCSSRVGFDDVNVLLAYFAKGDDQVPADCHGP